MPSKLNPKFSGLCELLEVRNPTMTVRKLETNRVFTASHDEVRATTLSRPEIPLQAEPPAEPSNTQNAESSAENFEIGRVENLRLFADDEWVPPSASQIPLLTNLDLTPPPPLSVLHCRRRNSLLVLIVISDFLHDSCIRSRMPNPTVTVECRSHAVVTAARTST